MGWGTFKPLLAEATVEALRPVQERYHQWRQESDAVAAVLRAGEAKAAAVANETLERVRQALGFLPRS
jgi:tryptophanyl-tRNA synthetase